ncbi:vacuolar protein sorting-associated protein 26A-like [Convolutriloba macropyga]|uniref:vacuolar protein sorting-associated protein 26A-like n=1 Tax=Convolutriloba macropyga TaxID=536237 RepID=UPI003F523FEA
MNFLFSPPDIDIQLSDARERKTAEVKVDDNGRRERLPLYYDGENISGKVHFTLKNNKTFEHNGIKIEFLGIIQMFNDRSSNSEFICLSKELARPGELSHSNSFPFEFREVEKPYETYYGATVKLRYLLRVTINKLLGNITKELGIAVHAMSFYPSPVAPDPNARTEVGIEDALHIEFEYDKPRYHLKDVIVGKVYFLVIRLKIKSMEVELLRKETTGNMSGSGSYNTGMVDRTECVFKYEVMDGSPNKGETVPIRIFLAGYDLQPTMREIAKKFSVRYFLNLVLVDEDDRRYYKTKEILLWRKYDKFYRKLRGAPDSSSTQSLSSAAAEFPSGPSTTISAVNIHGGSISASSSSRDFAVANATRSLNERTPEVQRTSNAVKVATYPTNETNGQPQETLASSKFEEMSDKSVHTSTNGCDQLTSPSIDGKMSQGQLPEREMPISSDKEENASRA